MLPSPFRKSAHLQTAVGTTATANKASRRFAPHRAAIVLAGIAASMSLAHGAAHSAQATYAYSTPNHGIASLLAQTDAPP